MEQKVRTRVHSNKGYISCTVQNEIRVLLLHDIHVYFRAVCAV